MKLPNPGEILLGKYRVEEIIGAGGMGRVVKASHLYLQQPVAIKILLPEMIDSESTIARFLREAQATVRLRSEHIARVMDVGTMPEGAPFIVMEYLEGHDLNQILRHHGPQMAQPVVDLMLQACEGIAEAHSIGIVHRDIKPSNFFITRRPDGSSLLKILDFGISKTPSEMKSELTGTQTVIGTPTYMAPEQMVSARSTDPRSDIWSIGVVMYQLLSGRPPFEAETYAQLVLQVGTAPPSPLHVPLPPGLQDILFRCLEKDPNQRMQTVGELARMLAPYASDPLTAQQSAERTTRILTTTQRSSTPNYPLASPGGLSMTPRTASPKSWNKTDASSLSGGAGQISTGTKVMRGGRGLVIAGVASLCILAGVGGFFVASSMRGDKRVTTRVEPMVQVRQPEEVATPVAPTPAATKPDATKNAKAAATTNAVTKSGEKATTTKTEAKPGATKTDSTTTEATKTETTKTRASHSSSHASHSSRTKSTPKSEPKADASSDLFDDRK